MARTRVCTCISMKYASDCVHALMKEYGLRDSTVAHAWRHCFNECQGAGDPLCRHDIAKFAHTLVLERPPALVDCHALCCKCLLIHPCTGQSNARAQLAGSQQKVVPTEGTASDRGRFVSRSDFSSLQYPSKDITLRFSSCSCCTCNPAPERS